MRPSESEVKDSIRLILADKISYATSLNFAVNYCLYSLIITDPEELRVQCIYILNNITHWRNPNAKMVRVILKSYVKKGA